MTETEWLACIDRERMLRFLHGKASERKLRLFAVACCRRIWTLLDQIGKKAVEHAEQAADGLITAEEQAKTEDLAWWGADGLNYEEDPIWSAGWAAHSAVEGSVIEASALAAKAVEDQGGFVDQCQLLREIVGNPFRHVTIDPAWLRWNYGTIPTTARHIYDERAFHDLPILADSLEDAGCTNSDILSHCRQSGEHVKGCWAIDLMLGKD